MTRRHLDSFGNLPLPEQIVAAGRMLYELGLVDSHSGNLSARAHGHVYATTRGAGMGRLRPEQVRPTTLQVAQPPEVTSEWIVHRAIYQACDASGVRAGAVVHTHPLHANAWALHSARLVPLDSEAGDSVGNIDVLEVTPSSASAQLAQAVSQHLTAHPAVLIRTHGLFVRGETLDEAVMFTCAVEYAARMRVLDLQLQLGKRAGLL